MLLWACGGGVPSSIAGSLEPCAADLVIEVVTISYDQVDGVTSLCLVLERKSYLAAGHVSSVLLAHNMMWLKQMRTFEVGRR